MKRTFTRNELEELGVPFANTHVVHDEQCGENRWSTVHKCVFQAEPNGPLWEVTYYLPATELQECDLWSYRNHGAKPETVEATQVEAYEVAVIKYRPVVEVVTNCCAHCGDVITLIDGAWKHRPGLRSPHDAEPSNLTAPSGAE